MFWSPSVQRQDSETPRSGQRCATSHLLFHLVRTHRHPLLQISSNGIRIETRHRCDRRSERSRCKSNRRLCIFLCLTMRISWNGFSNSAKIPTILSLLWSATPALLRDSSPSSVRKSLQSRGMSSTLIRLRCAQFPHVTPSPSTADLVYRALLRTSPGLEVERSTG